MELQDTKDQLFRVQKEFKVKITKNRNTNTKSLFALFMYYFALLL